MQEIETFKIYAETEKNWSHNTVDGYIRDIEQFFEFSKKGYNEVTHVDISSFIASIRHEGIGVSSSNRKLSAIKSFYKFLVNKEYLEHSPADTVECGKLEKRLPRTVDEEDINAVTNIADNLRDKTIFELLYGTGVRREELISIAVADINFTHGYIRVFGKGNKERIVPVHPKALRMCRRLSLENNSQWLFPSPKVAGQHLSKRRLNEIVQFWAEKAGLSDKHITPHKFRHSFGKVLYENGADIKAIQDMMGHSSIDTTNIYAKVSVARNQKEYLKFHPRAQEVG